MGTDPGTNGVPSPPAKDGDGTRSSSRPTGLGQAVGFLLSQLGYVVARQFRNAMSEVGLEPRHFALMRAIVANQGQSQNFLVDLLRIPASSMVSLVDHLEERGLIERRVHPSDRRARTLHVTGMGWALLDKATALAMALEQRICEGLSPEERVELIDRLQLVGQNLDVLEGVHPHVALGHDAPDWAEELGAV
ncbi:MAG TPA: MarR family winged helix-turn-helix transcriptional regulator [Acidimicrobiales bacterium]|nr:MarR family winged helix-turn-helix transcriptional regulator [Acidimicrobiales bacterium]